MLLSLPLTPIIALSCPSDWQSLAVTGEFFGRENVRKEGKELSFKPQISEYRDSRHNGGGNFSSIDADTKPILHLTQGLEKLAQGDNGDILDVTDSDADCVEVSLNGTWVAPESDSDEGLFVCVLSDRAESFLYQLWQDAQCSASVVNE